MTDPIDTTSSVPTRPLRELMDSGMLWLINRSTFHPRGFSLVLETDDNTGDVIGWKLLGNGQELWSFQHHNDEEKFFKAEATLKSLRHEEN
jgi:hypothetical protein